MKKSIRSVFIVLVFLTILLSGCAPASTPVPSTFTPSPIPPTFTPEPTSTATPLPSATPTSIPTDTPTSPPDPNQLSISDTQTVEFIGKKFELNWKVTDQPIRIYVYYPPNETPSDWIELVEFQIYPVNPDGNKPIDFAERIGKGYKQQYPGFDYLLLADKHSDAVLLEILYPTSTHKEEGKKFLEMDIFKFYSDPNSSQVISFLYSKNIDASSSRSSDDVISEMNNTTTKVNPAMAEFPLFSQ
jgi:hypothetical protein